MGWIPDPEFLAEQEREHEQHLHDRMPGFTTRRCLIAFLLGMLLGGIGMCIVTAGYRQQIETDYQARLAGLQAQLQSRFQVNVLTNNDPVIEFPPTATCTQPSKFGTDFGTVVFRNASSHTVHVTWLNMEAHEVPYYDVEPGSMVVQPTFADHRWCVRDQQDRLVLVVLVSRGVQVVDIPQ
jgi:VHL beta domain